MADKHHDLKPTGFAQQSALISVRVPIDDIFIHLRAVSDRPRYDMPTEQVKLLEALRQRSDLSPEQREEQFQALRVVWFSEMGQQLMEARQMHNAAVEDVLQQLTAEQPGAVILGIPGSGKSTTMRWFAYHMAYTWRLSRFRRWFNALLHLLSRITRTTLTWGYQIPEGLAPIQIPILIRISDYAKVLSQANGELSFHAFFLEHIKNKYSELPGLAERLLAELQQGHCLLLFDGLDEVASDDLRRRVAENITTFIANHAPEKPRSRHYNRFIITSRIVGYEAGAFANYAHYTLQDLEDDQIEQFLTKWCPIVERHQKSLAQSMKTLTPSQRRQADKEGEEQRNRLWEALQRSPGIKRLAVNPLMLTILALIQRSGKTLPHRRIDLYQVVTRTLLDNWNQETGRRVFPVDEIPLAEQMLACLAYQLHSTDLLLTEAKVKEIASGVMTEFYKQAPKDTTIKQFINTLRSSSGLFGESGQGLFSFMHRTFQEYFAALHLLSKPFDELQKFVKEQCHKAIWHEPFLLLIAYKSTQSKQEQQQASDLIGTIADTSDQYDVILHRNLLLAAQSVVDCSVWTIQHTLQQNMANHLFDLYGDAVGSGRYTQLQKAIEEIALLWLRGQPTESSDARPPLLDTWHTALCDVTNPVRQEGATHLLASLALDLPSCPKLVLSVLIPPLLKLARLDELADLPCPSEVRTQLSRTAARPSSLKVEEYALITLRLLDKDGPAGWLHEAWLKWSQEQPELLERLTQHSLEIDYLLTPAAFPTRYDPRNPHWQVQLKLGNEWKQRGQRNPGSLQTELLQESDAARYPHAYLYWRFLKAEVAALSTPWREVWDAALQKEMSGGLSATYQTCLHLRLLLYKDNQQQREQIANELLTALSTSNQLQTLTLIAITNLYMRYMRYMLNRDQLVDILCNTLSHQRATLSAALFALYSILRSYNAISPSMAQHVQQSLWRLERQAQQSLTTEHRQLIAVVMRLLHPSASSAQAHTSTGQGAPDAQAIVLYAFKQQRQLTGLQVEAVLQACTDRRAISEDKKEEVGQADTVQKVAWNLLDQQFDLDGAAVLLLIQYLGDKHALICASAARLLKNDSRDVPVPAREEAARKIMEILQDDVLSRRPLDPPDYSVWRLDDVLFETLKVLVE